MHIQFKSPCDLNTGNKVSYWFLILHSIDATSDKGSEGSADTTTAQQTEETGTCKYKVT